MEPSTCRDVIAMGPSLACPPLLYPSEDRESNARECKRQLVTDVRTTTNEPRNRTAVPGYIHPESSSDKAKGKGTSSSPTEWQ